MKTTSEGESGQGEGEREGEGEKEDKERKTETEGGRGGGPLTRISSIDPELRDIPAFKFITRPDLYQFAKVRAVVGPPSPVPIPPFQEEQNEVLFGDMAILELVQTIRSDHSLFARYQHSSKLVGLLNSFARTDCELPINWERRKDTKSGRVSFPSLSLSLPPPSSPLSLSLSVDRWCLSTIILRGPRTSTLGSRIPATISPSPPPLSGAWL